MRTKNLLYTRMESPVGTLLLAGDGNALHYLSFATGHKAFGPQLDWQRSDGAFAEVKAQLRAYFSGALVQFDLPLSLKGTEFQKSVWSLLTEIPFGSTRTYGELARTLNKPSASRAVGAANGSNPIPIILPCHRVIGSNGSLTGFGGGVETKRFLLKHEDSLPENA